MRRLVYGSALSVLLGALAYASDADACGGCFAPPVQGNDSGTIVTSHRMALSISAEQTILWDQIQYTGSPAEFAWVLPVKAGARIEVASQSWFDVLDAATGTAVSPPLLSCKSPGFFGCSVVPGMGTSFGCGASEADGGGNPLDPPDPVQVVSHGAIGPYESVILHSDVPGALIQWLESHKYAIPDDVVPVIEAYQNEGFDFAALRLLPSSGIQQMRPVRVVTPGASPVLPLRMVAAGTGARTAITLFVIGEGRYTTKNIPEVQVPRWLVNWDYTDASSNYSELRDTAYGGGSVFFSPYAERGAIFDEIDNSINGYATRYRTAGGLDQTTIAEAYVEQAFATGETTSTDCIDRFVGLEDDPRKVTLPCEDPADPTCGAVDSSTEIDARNLMCDPPFGSDIPLDDLAQAVMGMHPRDIWVTRLEANLSRPMLANDLEMEAAKNQSSTPGTFTAATITNIPPTCKLKGTGALAEGEQDRGGPGRPIAAMFAACLGLLLILRRLASGEKRRPALEVAK